jgi:hypothetical protein
MKRAEACGAAKKYLLPIILLMLCGILFFGVVYSGTVPQKNRVTLITTAERLWERFRKTLPPFTYRIEKDEIAQSDTDPRKALRRIDVKFVSQEVEGKKMGHSAVIFMPADPKTNRLPRRKGKVVVIAHAFGDAAAVGNYGEPIAARTGYPTMTLLLPGDDDGADGEGTWLRYFRKLAKDTKDPINHDFFRSAIPYLQALDIFSEILKEKKIRAIIGGHSKRAFYAFTAAAMDRERIAGVVYMGCERLFSDFEEFPASVNPLTTQKYIRCPVLYLGATNEDGYEMFNIHKIQKSMKRPWTIEYIANYRHASRSEIQFMDWQMWVSHVFDGRPITTISDLSHEETAEGSIFRARIDSRNKIIQAKVWYVYCDDVPYWRDLVWYPEIMEPKEGNLYEGYVEGKLPDAWLVEVKDIASGFAGYISSLPQDITHKPTKERLSRGSKSRRWEPKEKK